MNKKAFIPMSAMIGAFLLTLVAAMALFVAETDRAYAQTPDIDYAENGDGPVATFTAEDPEGATPITWHVLAANSGATLPAGFDAATDSAQAEHFMVGKDGVLKFDIAEANDGSSPGSPDFENGQGSGTGSNTYNVVVAACDVALADGVCPTTATPPGQAGYHKVTVKVTNVAEMGEVTWTVDPDGAGSLEANVPPVKPIMQFQVGAILSVIADGGVTDGDVATADKNVAERLQWYRSSSKTAMGTAIAAPTGTAATYTVTTEDIGKYIRVVASYNIGTGPTVDASLTSDYPVLASRTTNDAPEFSSTAVTREVSEGDKGMAVGAPVTATDDISNALNYTLSGTDSNKFKIDQKTGQITTTVKLDRERTTDVDATTDTPAMLGCGANYKCEVIVTATDSAGAATGATGNPDSATVTITLKNVDEKPEFDTGFKMRNVMEGMTQVDDDEDADNDPAGEAIYAATDPDGQSITYSLRGADAAKFQLNAAPLRSLSFRMKPDFENPTDANKDNVYEVTVRASDGVMYADRMVMVMVTEADEAPEIMGKDSIDYAENGDGPVATFTAEDPEGATPITWHVLAANSGATLPAGFDAATDSAQAEHFMVGKDGVLKFDIAEANDGSSPGSPDFENGQGSGTGSNTYNVVVAACDVALADGVCPTTATPPGQAGYHKVTVKVTNVAEMGEVTWTVDPDGAGSLEANVPPVKPIMQFQVGAILSVIADGGVTDGDVATADKNVAERLQWYRSSSKTAMGTAIAAPTGTAATYTVTTEDIGKYIRVVASYNIGTGPTVDASLTSDYPVLASRTTNDAPEFSSTAVTREVSEGDKGMAVGAPVTATDDISNALNYTLSGTDSNKFKIDQKTGQITTTVKLDRERTTDVDATTDTPAMLGCGANYKCEVIVTATDSAGAATGATGNPDSATVTITLKNVDEKPEFDTGFKMRNVMEGMTQVDDDEDADNDPAGEAIYAATDPDGQSITYSLRGADAAKFQLNAAPLRSLSFRMKPDFENPTDANKDNVYEVTVRASDGVMYADRMVMVTVTDVDEAPEIMEDDSLRISGPSSRNYAENGTGAVATYLLSGANKDRASWSLAGDDRGDFTIGSDGMLRFRNSPDYESPSDANGDNVYMVTVRASYGASMDTHEVVVTVTDEDEMVIGGDLLDRYDADDSGTIDLGEVVQAILDYQRDALSLAEVVQVILLYQGR